MSLEQALMQAHDYTAKEAASTINEMRTRVREGEDPEEILYEYGLEPDFVLELLE